MHFIVCGLLYLFTLSVAHANLIVEQPPKAYGYFIGDVLLQRVQLTTADGLITPPALEDDQRIDTFLHLMPVIETTAGNQQWLELRYQIINAPAQTQLISLPALTFTAANGDQLTLPAWQFTVAPLTATDGESQPSALPDRNARNLIRQHSTATLRLSLAALAITAGLWLLWWLFRHFKDPHTLPFAKANRTIKRLPGATRDNEPNAWIALHHAFNQVAGKTISGNSLPELFDAAPWLADHQSAIKEFYTASAERFFQPAGKPPVIAVSDLCQSLQRTEKRQARTTPESAAS